MTTLNHRGSILPQDIDPGDFVDLTNTSQPITLSEVEDLLYGEDRPAEERLDRLREFREILVARDAGDVADNDTAALLGEIDTAIERLGGTLDQDRDETDDDFIALGGAMDRDPSDHRETLSPDDDELLDLEDQEEEDEDDREDAQGLSVLDPEEWDEDDSFDPEQGTR